MLIRVGGLILQSFTTQESSYLGSEDDKDHLYGDGGSIWKLIVRLYLESTRMLQVINLPYCSRSTKISFVTMEDYPNGILVQLNYYTKLDL